jgi:hypothetical protein
LAATRKAFWPRRRGQGLAATSASAEATRVGVSHRQLEGELVHCALQVLWQTRGPAPEFRRTGRARMI